MRASLRCLSSTRGAKVRHPSATFVCTANKQHSLFRPCRRSTDSVETKRLPIMKNCAFVAGTGSSFAKRLTLQGSPNTAPRARKSSNYQVRKRSRAKVVCREKLEPVENGVTLPQHPDVAALQDESQWLSEQLTDWLDAEWWQGEPQPIHRAIGERTAQIYTRQRMEGQDDLSSVLIAIGSELEGMDFSSSFVGPWNVANKTSELLLEHRAGPRVRLKPYVRDPNAPTWASEMEKQKQPEGQSSQQDKSKKKTRRKVGPPPNLVNQFERLMFLRDILDESVPAALVGGAVALIIGYRFDNESGQWNGEEVEDEHFRQFRDSPPDVLGDERSPELTDTLKHLEKQLGLDEDETGELAEGLDMVIETLHGTELTRIQRKDENDHAFRKREIVVKWLHLKGGF